MIVTLSSDMISDNLLQISVLDFDLSPSIISKPLFLKKYKKEDRQTDGQDLTIKSPRLRLKIKVYISILNSSLYSA